MFLVRWFLIITSIIPALLFFGIKRYFLRAKKKLDYENCPEQSREIHFAKTEKKERYELLRKRLLETVDSGWMRILLVP